jgi:hypothetical protein
MYTAYLAQGPYLRNIASKPIARRFPSSSTTSKEAYAESDTLTSEVQMLKSAFKDMHLRANAKVTSDRIFSMVVHPDPKKNLVFAGDKSGMLGM